MTEYTSIEELLDTKDGHNIHIECGHEVSADLLVAVRNRFARRRCAYLLETDRGYARASVHSYLTLFARIAGSAVKPSETIARFKLESMARTKMGMLTHEQTALVNFARMSLFEPEVCFCERPLAELGADARHSALRWITERTNAGCMFVTTLQPLREALLMPGDAFWNEDGRFFAAQREDEDAPYETNGTASSHDEVHICKIPAKTDAATLLLDPRDIDFIESSHKTNYVSVRGTLYPTPFTMAELENELLRFGFFRTHRSFIVNVQRVAKIERYTRNSFNLILNDAADTSIPLSKGRAEEMRERFGW